MTTKKTASDFGNHLVEPWSLQDEEARSKQLQEDVISDEHLQHEADWPSEDGKQQQGVDVSIQGGSGVDVEVEEKSCRNRWVLKHTSWLQYTKKVSGSHLQQKEPMRELLGQSELAPAWMKCGGAWLFQKSQRTDTWSCAASSSAWPRTCFPYCTDVRVARPPQTAPP